MDEGVQDVIIIGAGLAGLTAAALLANRGLKVLLLEQHYQPGGSCGAFRRNGVTFDQGTSMLFGFGSRGFNPHRFVMNELGEPIEVIRHDTLYTLKYGGVPIRFHSDLNLFFQDLSQLFDDDEMAQVRAFYRYIGDLYHKVIAANPICVAPSEIPPSVGLRMLLRHPLKQLKLLSLLKKSAGFLVRKFITSERVIGFFNKMTSTYCYTLIDETPAILIITMFMDNHVGGSYYPVGSSQQLAGKLERAFERLGGRVLYGTRVKEILFENGRAVGVAAEQAGKKYVYKADAVVHAGTVWDFYGSLIPAGESSEEIRRWAASLVPTYPSVVLHCLVDASVIPEDTPPIIMLADNPGALDEKEITLYIFSLADPSICPAGTHTVMAIGPSLREWPSPADGAYRSDGYMKAKREETKRLLDTLERHFPGFSRGLLYNTLATPTTLQRYVMKWRGSVAGPKQAMGQDLLNRQHASTSWENLFMCGESTVMGTGSPAVTISGISAANMVLRRLGKKEYWWRPDIPDAVIQVDARKAAKRDASGVIRGNCLPDGILRDLHDRAALCQWCEVPPCMGVCPAGIDIRGITRRIEMGNILGASRLLEGTDRLSGEISCKACPAPCQTECRRKNPDLEPVAIRPLLIDLAEAAGEKA